MLTKSKKCLELAEEIKSGLEDNSKSYLKMDNAVAKFAFKLRAGVLPLEVEVQRYTDIPREERKCKICCLDQLEDNRHFCLECPAVADERRELFCNSGLVSSSFSHLSSSSPQSYISKNELYYHLLGLPTVTKNNGDQELIFKGLYKMWRKRCELRASIVSTGAKAHSVGQSNDLHGEQ